MAHTMLREFVHVDLARPLASASIPLVGWGRCAKVHVPPNPMDMSMVESFLVSASVVGLAEVGDRTQFLALALACHYKKPIPILGGILIATLASNIIAAYAGAWVGALLTPAMLKWILVGSFVAMALWVLVPEKSDNLEQKFARKRDVLLMTIISFFVAEAADKTQFATAALAAHFDQIMPVVLGSTFGMMAVNLPVVWGGHYFDKKITASPLARYIACALFLGEALITFLGYRLI